MNQALESLRSGKTIILVDDSTADPHAFLLQAASAVSAADIAFHVNLARSVIMAPLTESRLEELGLRSMLPGAAFDALSGIEFAVSVDARHYTTTGISSSDRAQTLRMLAMSTDAKRDLVMPGHIFPLRAKDQGVLVRVGIAEAAVDALRLAGQVPVGALSHLLNERGEFITANQVQDIAQQHQLQILFVSEIVSICMSQSQLIEKVSEAEIPTATAGLFRAIVFKAKVDGSDANNLAEHVALVKGEIAEQAEPILVRVQAEHLLGDLLGTDALNSRKNLHGALTAINQAGKGVFVYIRHPRKGFLATQIKNLSAPATGMPAKQPLRQYGIGAQILRSLGVKKIALLTNSSTPVIGLDLFGLELVKRVPFELAPRGIDFSFQVGERTNA
ncbi:3,4-dihydroxy-2-butanone-4-phosphate synthase [bacterium]|nr:3,4-dihydroxy-2-butanone-4-phosphate synthase [bacterium]